METREVELMYRLELAHWWFAGKRAALASLIRAAGGAPRGRVLDLGCGTGAILSEVLQGRQAVGLEYDPVCLGLACRRVEAPLVRGAAHRLPFADDSFAMVTCLDVLTHDGVPAVATLAECRRVLMPGGLLIIMDSAYHGLVGPHDRSMHISERFSATGLATRARAAGLIVRRTTYRNTILAPVLIAERLLRRGLARVRTARDAAPHSDVVMPPAVVNRLLTGLLSLEARWLAHRDLAFGSSVCLVAAKPVR